MSTLGAGLVLLGAMLNLVGMLGLFRFRDIYARAHAASLTDAFAAFIIVSGLLLMTPSLIVTLKLVMLMMFLLLSSPTATHALAQAALHAGVLPQKDP